MKSKHFQASYTWKLRDSTKLGLPKKKVLRGTFRLLSGEVMVTIDTGIIVTSFYYPSTCTSIISSVTMRCVEQIPLMGKIRAAQNVILSSANMDGSGQLYDQNVDLGILLEGVINA